MFKNAKQIMQCGVILGSLNAPKPLAAGALPRTPLGELIAFPQTPQLDLEEPCGRGGGGEAAPQKILPPPPKP